jgi:hypothetical protein
LPYLVISLDSPLGYTIQTYTTLIISCPYGEMRVVELLRMTIWVYTKDMSKREERKRMFGENMTEHNDELEKVLESRDSYALDYAALNTGRDIVRLIEEFVEIQSQRGIAKDVALNYVRMVCDNV